jgi:drug/metabolite transporter (DMT)-like permease
MSAFWAGNVFLLLSILCASASQLVFKVLFNATGPLRLDWAFFEVLHSWDRFGRLVLASALLVAGFLFWLLSLSRLNISYAYPIACSSAALVTWLGVAFLGETVSARMWGGTLLIVVGTALIVPPGN